MRSEGLKISKSLGVLSVLIFLLIVVGGLVRNLGAGLSCPDWPLCQGRIIPEFDLKVFAEYFHRLFAASVSLLTLVLAVIIFSKSPYKNLRKPMALAIVLLFSQVILGGLTVLQLLKSEIVTLHLATGTLFFATVVYMTLKARWGANSETVRNDTMYKWGLLATTVIYIQIILGGVVSSHYAGLACPDFPTCYGSWWPNFVGLVGIQWVHRLGATGVFLIVLSFAMRLMSGAGNFGIPQNVRPKAVVILILLCTQVALGVSYVLLRIAVPLSVTHLAVAEALLALVLISTYEIRHFKLR